MQCWLPGTPPPPNKQTTNEWKQKEHVALGVKYRDSRRLTQLRPGHRALRRCSAAPCWPPFPPAAAAGARPGKEHHSFPPALRNPWAVRQTGGKGLAGVSAELAQSHRPAPVGAGVPGLCFPGVPTGTRGALSPPARQKELTLVPGAHVEHGCALGFLVLRPEEELAGWTPFVLA